MAAVPQLPKVVHLKIKNKVVVQDCSLYIGRQQNQGGWHLAKSPWANPYCAKKFGRAEAIAKYRAYILDKFREHPEYWANQLKCLLDQTLGCWCKPEACHGDVLVDFLKSYHSRYGDLILTPERIVELANELQK